MQLESQEMRKLAPELDPLRLEQDGKRRSGKGTGHGGKHLR